MKLIFLLTALALQASDWPRYRGPNGTGLSADTALPDQLDKEKSVRWKAAIPKGNSSPIVIGNRLWITGHDGDKRELLCYDTATGKLLWRQGVTRTHSDSPHPLNGFTTPTPVTDNKSIFAFFPDFGLIAYSFEGKELWRKPLGPFAGIQGVATSPLYVDGNVVLLIDTPEESYLAAFDAKTGKQTWKTERPIGFLGSYATPSLDTRRGEIVVAGAVELTGYQAKTGERLWWSRGATTAPAALPLIDGDAVYTVEPAGDGAPPFAQMLSQYDKDKNGQIELAEITGDSTTIRIMQRLFGSIDRNAGDKNGIVTEKEFVESFADKGAGGLARTALGGKGDIGTTRRVWRHTKGMPYVTAPLLYRDVLYVVRDGGILATFNPADGKLLGESRLKDALGAYYASPIAADGKIYFFNQEGKVTVIRAADKDGKWEQISSGDLGEQVIATPAIAGSRIFVRTANTLYCFGLQKSI